MPLLAYFWKVGAALLALLFIADFWLPAEKVAPKASVDQPTIRIQSVRKWPERVILDTSLPTIVAAMPETLRVETAASTDRAEPPVIRAETPVIANALAMAPTEQPAREAVDRKRPRKTQHATRSRRHAPSQMLLAARQAQFAWFGPRYW